MRKRNRIAIAVTGLAFAALVAAKSTQGEPTVFRDKKGDLSLTGVGSFHFERIDSNHSRVVLKARDGGKVHLVSQARRMQMEGSTVDATLSPDSSGSLSLNSATVSGGVHAVVKRPSSQAGAKDLQTATIDASTAVYTAGEETIKVSGSVVITDSDPAASQQFHATGSSGLLRLSPATNKGRVMRDGNLQGPVELHVSGKRAERSANGARTLVPMKMDGTCDRMEFADAGQTVRMIGHVHLDTDDPTFPATLTTQTITIHLTAGGEVESIDSDGPGETTFKEGMLTGKGGR